MSAQLTQRIGRLPAVLATGRHLTRRRDLLRPGLWLAESPVVWRRMGVVLPDFLRSTKAPAKQGWGPAMLWVRGRGSCDVAVATFEGGGVYLDLSHRLVTRTYPTGHEPDQQHIDLRERFERQVAAPRARYADDRASHVEEYVVGQHLSQLSLDDQLRVLAGLMADYGRLVRTEGERDASADMAVTIGRALDLNLPATLQKWVQGARDVVSEMELPWVPSAREANLKNLIVRDDLRASPIDLGDLMLLPALWYPLGIITEAGAEVVGSYRAGVLDEPVFGLLGASPDCALSRRPHWREELLVARMIYVSAQGTGGPAGTQATSEEMRADIERRWEQLRRLLSADA